MLPNGLMRRVPHMPYFERVPSSGFLLRFWKPLVSTSPPTSGTGSSPAPPPFRPFASRFESFVLGSLPPPVVKFWPPVDCNCQPQQSRHFNTNCDSDCAHGLLHACWGIHAGHACKQPCQSIAANPIPSFANGWYVQVHASALATVDRLVPGLLFKDTAARTT